MIDPKELKKLGEGVEKHYSLQQENLIKLDRLFKKKNPSTLDEFLELAIARSKPYPMALAHHVWKLNEGN